MKKNERINEKKSIYIKIVFSVLFTLFFFVLIIGLIIGEMNTKDNEGKTIKRRPKKVQEENNKGSFTGIIKEINQENKEIIVYDFIDNKDIKLTYSGISDIRDKYNTIIAITQISLGNPVDITFNDDYIESMNISKEIWEYGSVKNIIIDNTNREIQVGANKYRFLEGIIVLNNNRFVDIESLAKQDILTIWGYDEYIYSIKVNKGHGYVKLSDYNDFIGGLVTVANEEAKEIGDETLIVAREGEHNITIENKFFTVTKRIKVDRDEETIVSLKDLGPEAIKSGLITIKTEPYNSDLYIDNKLTLYDKPLELPYGIYDIEIKQAGYHSYIGFLEVNSSSKVLNVTLPEVQFDEEVNVEIDDSNSDYNNDNHIDLGKLFDGEYEVDKEHYIYIQNPIGASVYLNGEYVITSPGKIQKIIGKHVLTFIKDNYKVKSYTIEVADDGLDKYISMPDLEEYTNLDTNSVDDDTSSEDEENFDID